MKIVDRFGQLVIFGCVASLIGLNSFLFGGLSVASANCANYQCDEVASLYITNATIPLTGTFVHSEKTAPSTKVRSPGPLTGEPKQHTDKIKVWANCELVLPLCANPVDDKYYEGSLTNWDGTGDPPEMIYGEDCEGPGETRRAYCEDQTNRPFGVAGSWD